MAFTMPEVGRWVHVQTEDGIWEGRVTRHARAPNSFFFEPRRINGDEVDTEEVRAFLVDIVATGDLGLPYGPSMPLTPPKRQIIPRHPTTRDAGEVVKPQQPRTPTIGTPVHRGRRIDLLPESHDGH